jgi:multimeric flavodoxin WrbA
LIEQLLAADIWVLGTPVYFFAPSGIFKDFIDRWYLFCDEKPNPAEGKKVVLVAPHADAGDEVAEPVVGMVRQTCDYMGMDFVGQVLVTVGNRGAVGDRPEELARARFTGRQAALAK